MVTAVNPFFTRRDYCNFLFVSQINYTITYLADRLKKVSHDVINRYLQKDKVSARTVWNSVKDEIKQFDDASLIFDDSVLDKRHSHHIDSTRMQWSGNAKKPIKGIGLVSCIYYNPKTDEHWLIDYRIYDPDVDGKTKLDHMKEMISNAIEYKKIPFKTVLMDTWYATKDMMMYIDSLDKIFYCPIKSNRSVDDTRGVEKYKRADSLTWTDEELVKGKIVKLKDFPGDYRVKLFRVPSRIQKTELIVTNDHTQESVDQVEQYCGIRWNIEEYYREIKQTTGIESCQCRKRRIQRNHIDCSLLLWSTLKSFARKLGRSIYEIKNGLLDDYMIAELANPSVKLSFQHVMSY